MRAYGQCMVILPDELDELGGSETGRWYYPVPDEYGGQFIETGPRNSFDHIGLCGPRWPDEEEYYDEYLQGVYS